MTIQINLTGRGVHVYGGLNGSGGQVGTILNRELFTYLGSDGYDNTSVAFYSPSGWRQGYVYKNSDLFGWSADAGKYGSPVGGDYAFKVLHRQSRIFSGTNVIHAVQPGGWIWTNGYSTSGSSYPYRLGIIGYSDDGITWKSVTNGWCDTDMEIGYDMYNTVTIDGNWV